MSDALTLPDLRQELFYKALVQLPYVDAIYVYGSHSTGRANNESDVDLAIECPDATDEQWQHIKNIIDNVPCLLMFDVQRMDTMPRNDFYEKLIKTRSVLFVRSPGEHIDFVKILHDSINVRLASLLRFTKKTSLSAEEIKQISTDFYDVFRLSIRLMRRALLVHDVRAVGRVMTLRFALQKGWIKDRQIWEEMYMAWMMIEKNPAPFILSEILSKMPLYLQHLDAVTKRMLQFYHDEKQAIANREFSPHSSVKSDYA